MDFSLIIVVAVAAGMFYISFPQQTLEFLQSIMGVLSSMAASLVQALGSLRKGE